MNDVDICFGFGIHQKVYEEGLNNDEWIAIWQQ